MIEQLKVLLSEGCPQTTILLFVIFVLATLSALIGICNFIQFIIREIFEEKTPHNKP